MSHLAETDISLTSHAACFFVYLVPFYIARKPAKAMLPDPLPLDFWNGVTLSALQRISPDVCDFMTAYGRKFECATVRSFSLYLGGVPAEEGSLWFCVLHSSGVLSKLPSWNFEKLASETSKFKADFHFFPNPARLLKRSHLPQNPKERIESAAFRAKAGEAEKERPLKRSRRGSGSGK